MHGDRHEHELEAASSRACPGTRSRRPAALRLPLHGQRARGRDDRRRHGRRDRLVHGAAPPDLRRAHALADRVPRRGRGGARRGCRLAVGYFGFCGARRAGALAGIAGRARAASAPSRPRSARCRRSRSRCGFLFVEPLPRRPQRPRLAAVRHLPRHHRRAGAVLLVVAALAVLVALVAIAARPLFFASVDADVAPRRGVPVRLLGLGFLLVLGLCGGRDEPDHGRAARVRAAGHARRRPRTLVTARPGLEPRARRSRSRSRSPGSGSRSPTSRSTRSASTSRRSRSASTSAGVRGRGATARSR